LTLVPPLGEFGYEVERVQRQHLGFVAEVCQESHQGRIRLGVGVDQVFREAALSRQLAVLGGAQDETREPVGEPAAEV
jgi:hypothetical protein